MENELLHQILTKLDIMQTDIHDLKQGQDVLGIHHAGNEANQYNAAIRYSSTIRNWAKGI